MGRSMEEAHTYGQYRGRLAAVCCRLCTVFGLSPLLAFLRLRFFRVLRFESVNETRGSGVPLFHVTLSHEWRNKIDSKRGRMAKRAAETNCEPIGVTPPGKERNPDNQEANTTM
eukprot:GHVU01129134.1.p3 GENE.GHVU01129134.1~~GHVU01129134.1.p3  ORF type:complete len:114 (+),score=6.70 GHVU01129134.1:591-932(+)